MGVEAGGMGREAGWMLWIVHMPQHWKREWVYALQVHAMFGTRRGVWLRGLLPKDVAWV